MAERQSDDGSVPDGTIIVRRRRWRRLLGLISLGILAVLIALIVAVWIARRPIANQVLEQQFEQRGVARVLRLSCEERREHCAEAEAAEEFIARTEARR